MKKDAGRLMVQVAGHGLVLTPTSSDTNSEIHQLLSLALLMKTQQLLQQKSSKLQIKKIIDTDSKPLHLLSILLKKFFR